MTRTGWDVKQSETAKHTSNPIRAIVDQLKIVPCPGKDLISVSIGDPTVFGNLPTHDSVVDAVIDAVKSSKANGYTHSTGYEHAREAVAERYSHPDAPLTSKDVIIASGCSGALDLAITALANPGQNILIPRPGFSLYQTLADSKGIKVRHYNLLPEKNWEIDLEHLQSLVDDQTAAIVVNNPSNPCGSNYSRAHLLDILQLAEKNFLPIISDEIYADMVFSGQVFEPMAPLTKTVPILACGGIAKQFLVPGWRVGWLMIHDRNNTFKEIREGLLKLTTLILGANTIVQDALPTMLHKTPRGFLTATLATIEEHAKLSYEMLGKIDGLVPIMPQGTMYFMVGIQIEKFKDIANDMDFVQKLVTEQSVFALPASCFAYPNFFRIVITVPKDKLKIAYERLAEFCAQHRK
ncbi:tyrosine aminotransferase [Capsaspora owczarzaki ATCC 30864]|uniref:Tyrosine aminotransferase n=1 Tax=Capsaspora owczarzaki (strain ATCC 30864) TaxID=595528 RepID=A0A0D2X4R6_CAPO3|nr:tyrosine aminotransferase [Capsaspora owczarzaki ATCC 30864]KJE96524.1 tyrosine aminotransferase [Capsaspora owczarzaki ATCC 30864]|eukprot:XP_004344454.2 tyrosine aminotransferase [Capsaspora owczarzaki ATCC 30864]